MAGRKETIKQTDFSLGAPRPEAVEQDESKLIAQSVKACLNTTCTTTGQIQERPGTVRTGNTTAAGGFEVDLGAGRLYDLHITPTGLVLYDPDEAVEHQETSTDWTAITGKFGTYTFDEIEFWVLPDPDGSAILIGSNRFPIQALVVDAAGAWSFGAFAFYTSPVGAVKQPYINYYAGVTIQPSARTGTITVTASSSIFTSAHAGMRIRYVDREILFTTYSSGTVMNATVVEELPPTYTITVASASGYQKGDAVEHSTSGGLGIITNISGTNITVLSTSKYDGFPNSGALVGPNASQNISGVSSASPAASGLWDIQMQSPVHGYAGTAARHKGRLYLGGFPGSPMAFAASAAGSTSDFTLGTNDGDAFVEIIAAATGGAIRYIVSAEDLLFLTSKGLYYQPTRDGGAVTPQTIGPVSFSRLGCAQVRPVTVEDGCIFIDAVGGKVYAAVLAGDIYRAWRAQHLTKYHPQHVTSPIWIGATASGSEDAEDFIYVVNADGTAAVAQWDREENFVSWRPWSTDGAWLAIYQAFGKTWCVANRTVDGASVRFRERFERGVYLDAAALLSIDAAGVASEGVETAFGVTALGDWLAGNAATVYFERWDLGDQEIDTDGTILDPDGNPLAFPEYEGVLQYGFPYEVEIIPWSRRSVHTQRGTREVKRQIQMMVTVLNSGPISVDGFVVGDYASDEDLTMPPPLRSEEYKFTFVGRPPFEERVIRKHRPGPLTLAKLRYRVVI